MKLKKASYKNGRGYCGYHTGHFNQRVFCRSLVEKIYAMILDSYQIYYEMENQTYKIDGCSYKPDFFLFDENNNLNKIIEVKDNKKEKDNYLHRFKWYFDRMNIQYEVIVLDKRKYLQSEWKDELEGFKDNSNSYVMSGENNPIYEMERSNSTKEKIGIKTKERWNNNKERERMIRRTNEEMTYERRLKISKERKKQERKKRRKELMAIIDQFGGFLEKECVICGEIFLNRAFSNLNYCGEPSCTQIYWKRKPYKVKWSKEKKINKFKNTLLRMASNNFDLEEIEESTFPLLRKERLYDRSPLSLKSIKKYFGDIQNFKKELEEWQELNQ